MKKIKIKVIGAKDFYIVPEQFFDLKLIVGKKLKPIKAKIIGARDFYIVSEVFLPEGISAIDFLNAVIPNWENTDVSLYDVYSFGESPSPAFSYLKRKILYSPILVLNIAYNPYKVIPRVFKTGIPVYPTPFYSHFFPRIRLADMTRWVKEGKKQAKIKIIYSFKTLSDKYFNNPYDDVKVNLSELTSSETLLDYTQGKYSDKITLKVYPTGDFQDNEDEVWIYELYVSPLDAQPINWVHQSIEYYANADWVEQIIDENTGRTWTKGVNWPPTWNDEDFGDRTGTLVGRESEETFSNIHTFKISRLTTDEEGYVRVKRMISSKVHSFYYTVLLPINRQESLEYLKPTDPTNRPLWFNINDIIGREYWGYSRFDNVSIPFDLKDYVDTIDKNYNNKIKVKCRGGKQFSYAYGHPYYDVAYSTIAFPNLSSTSYVFYWNNTIYTQGNSIYEIDLSNRYFREYQNAYRSNKMGPYTWDISTVSGRKKIEIRYLYPQSGILKREGIQITAPAGKDWQVGWVSSAGVGTNEQIWIVYIYDQGTLGGDVIGAYINTNSVPINIVYGYISILGLIPQFFGDFWTGNFFIIVGNNIYRISHAFPLFFNLFIYQASLPLSTITKMVNINGANMGLIDSSGNTKFFEFYSTPNFSERTWNIFGGTGGNINRGITGTYDGSGNIKLFAFPGNTLPGYGSFGTWGGRLIWTKDISSISTSYSFGPPYILTFNNGLPPGFAFTFFVIDPPLFPTNDGYFRWLPDT
jgi:hypothetical protein